MHTFKTSIYSHLLLIFVMVSFALILANPGECRAQQRAENAVSFQPLGLLFFWSNVEYERLVVPGDVPLSVLGRVNFTTQTIGTAWLSPFKNSEYNSMWTGFGAGARIYYGKNRMESFFAGINIDYCGGTYRNEYVYWGQPTEKSGSFTWLSFEFGRKFVFGRNGHGLFLAPSASWIIFLERDLPTSFDGDSYSIGLALGYQF